MNLLDNSTVDSMLADVRLLEGNFGDLRDDMQHSLCCHIKALAAEREELLKHRESMSWRIQRLHDATIVLRGAINTMPENVRGRLKHAVEQANDLIVKAGTA